ncbi:MAG TPA: carbohydrate ABC transporter permease [Chloroflexota bacterium]
MPTFAMPRRVIPYLLLTGIAAFFLFPIVWVIWTSLKTQIDSMAIPPIWTFNPQWHHYIDIWSVGTFTHDFLNTIVVGVLTIALTLVLGIPFAYSLARLRPMGGAVAGAWLIVVRMLPEMVFLIPLYTLFRAAGLFDTDLGLIIAFQIYTLPYTTWLLVGYIQSVPGEIDEAARIDGCGTVILLWRVVVPLIAPGIVATAVLSFVTVWTNLLFPLTLAYSNANTVSLAIANFQGYANFDWSLMAAATVASTGPQIVFFILVQRFIVRGLTLGAIKG